MRVFILCAALAACDPAARPAAAPPGVTGVQIDASTGDDQSTGDQPRLDLGPETPIPDLPPDEAGTSTGADLPTSGGADASTGGSTGEPASTSGAASTGGEDSSTSGGSSTGGEEPGTSTGEPPAPVCGDGVCDPAERAPCWGPGWCFADCLEDPACEDDCPCTPAAAAAKSFCYADPPPACAATEPGGYCDPNGDGLPDDGDATRGFYAWSAKCE